MVSAMGMDAFLTRLINELAGQSSWMDWWFLYLSDPDVLWLPGILLASIGCGSLRGRPLSAGSAWGPPSVFWIFWGRKSSIWWPVHGLA